MNRSMFTKSDRSVGPRGTDDWCRGLSTNMMLCRKGNDFLNALSFGIEEMEDKVRKMSNRKDPSTGTPQPDISTTAVPDFPASTLTRCSFSFSALLSPFPGPCVRSAHCQRYILPPIVAAIVNVTNFVSECLRVTEIDNFGNVASSSQPAGTPSRVIKISRYMKFWSFTCDSCPRLLKGMTSFN